MTPVVVRERIDREDFSIGMVGEAQFETTGKFKNTGWVRFYVFLHHSLCP